MQVETASGLAERSPEVCQPVQLQVVANDSGVTKPEVTEITLAHLETISVERALLSFMRESIRDVARDTGINEATLRSCLSKAGHSRRNARYGFRGEKQTEGMPNNAVDALDGAPHPQ